MQLCSEDKTIPISPEVLAGPAGRDGGVLVAGPSVMAAIVLTYIWCQKCLSNFLLCLLMVILLMKMDN